MWLADGQASTCCSRVTRQEHRDTVNIHTLISILTMPTTDASRLDREVPLWTYLNIPGHLPVIQFISINSRPLLSHSVEPSVRHNRLDWLMKFEVTEKENARRL
jgi:hypothetical protein